MFTIDIDMSRRMISIIFPLDLSTDMAAQLVKDKTDAVLKLGDTARGHVTFMDVRALRLQPQAIMQMFAHYTTQTELQSRKVAILIGDGTSKMQFRRLAEIERIRSNMRLFTDAQSAQDWLMES